MRKGGGIVKRLVEAVLEDLSSREVFLFRALCAGCGAAFGNHPRPFTKAGVRPQTPGRQILYDVLYEQEFHAARQAAIRDAAEQMNRCPVCRRLVCNGCFLICEELDLCAACADLLGQAGVRVLQGMVDAAV